MSDQEGSISDDVETPRHDALQFGEFRMDMLQRMLFRRGEPVHIQRKPLLVLTYLIQQAPRLVPREELLERFWSKSVNEESLTRCISTIRKLLGDNNDPPQYLETYHAQGYRFIAEVVAAPSNSRPLRQESRSRRRLVVAIALLFAAVVAVTTKIVTDSEPSTASQDSIDRIAVLPVAVDMADGAWLEQALTDHVMRAVSVIEGVTVVAASQLSDDADFQEQVERLGVRALLLSRLEETPAGSKLSAQLVDSHDRELLWQSSFNSVATTIDSSQVEALARQVAIRLRPTLQLRQPARRVDEQAYALYLRGRYFWSQRSAVGLEAAIAAFEQALDIDQNYLDAMLGAAESWLLLPLYGARPPIEAIPNARVLAQEVLAADPQDARARAVLGVIAMQYDWDWLTAESLLREAVTLNPNDATAQQWLGELYCYTARFDECRRQLRIALELDPLSSVLLMQQGTPDLYSGNYADAALAYVKAAENAPEFAMGQYALGLAFAGLDDWEQAIVAYQTSLPELGLAIVGGPLVHALARGGRIDAAHEMLREIEALAATRYVPPSKLAVAYLGIGDNSKAVASLQLAIEAHDDRLVYFAGDVHFRDRLYEAGFREVAERIGLREYDKPRSP